MDCPILRVLVAVDGPRGPVRRTEHDLLFTEEQHLSLGGLQTDPAHVDLAIKRVRLLRERSGGVRVDRQDHLRERGGRHVRRVLLVWKGAHLPEDAHRCGNDASGRPGRTLRRLQRLHSGMGIDVRLQRAAEQLLDPRFEIDRTPADERLHDLAEPRHEGAEDEVDQDDADGHRDRIRPEHVCDCGFTASPNHHRFVTVEATSTALPTRSGRVIRRRGRGARCLGASPWRSRCRRASR